MSSNVATIATANAFNLFSHQYDWSLWSMGKSERLLNQFDDQVVFCFNGQCFHGKQEMYTHYLHQYYGSTEYQSLHWENPTLTNDSFSSNWTLFWKQEDIECSTGYITGDYMAEINAVGHITHVYNNHNGEEKLNEYYTCTVYYAVIYWMCVLLIVLFIIFIFYALSHWGISLKCIKDYGPGHSISIMEGKINDPVHKDKDNKMSWNYKCINCSLAFKCGRKQISKCIDCSFFWKSACEIHNWQNKETLQDYGEKMKMDRLCDVRCKRCYICGWNICNVWRKRNKSSSNRFETIVA